MPRFTKEAKEIFDLIWYKADIEQSEIISKGLTDLSDRTFAKIWTSFYYFMFFRPTLALLDLKEAKELNFIKQDSCNSFFINTLYFWYNAGWNGPPVSLDLAKEYYKDLVSWYNQLEYYDDWEKYFCEGLFYLSKGWYSATFEANLEEAVLFVKKTKETFRSIPIDNEYLSIVHGNLNLAVFQRLAGYFDEAEKNLKMATQEAKKYNTLWEELPLRQLEYLYIQKGELQKAIECTENAYIISKKFNYYLGIYLSLGIKGDLFYEEGKYNKALESYQESLKYRKQYNDPLEIFKGYVNIFFLLYQNYKRTKEKEHFKKTEEILLELKKFNEQYPDDKTIKNMTKYSEARLLKYGNITKQAKAVLLFEELMKIYPNNVDIVKEYLELLFDDFLKSEDQDTIDKIDALMKKVFSFPLFFSSITNFVHQQIIIAQYQYFIKNDIESAFKIINDANEKILPLNIEHYSSQLEHELINFKNNRSIWEKADYSVKERILKSEIDKYIQDGLRVRNEYNIY